MSKEDFIALVDAWQEACLADENTVDLDAMEAAIRDAPWEFTVNGDVRRK